MVVILQSTYRVPILHEDLPYAQSHFTPGLCSVCPHPVPEHLQFETQANGFRFCQIPLSRSLVGKEFLGTASARASGIAPPFSSNQRLDSSICQSPKDLHTILLPSPSTTRRLCLSTIDTTIYLDSSLCQKASTIRLL